MCIFIIKLSLRPPSNHYLSDKTDRIIDLIISIEMPFISDISLSHCNITYKGIIRMRKCKWKDLKILCL
jgi:hypothetical protein